MATTAPTPSWSYGNVVNYTDSGVTDDTEQWSYGNVLSHLEYAAAAGIEVTATLDTLVITEYAATVKFDLGITTGLDTLVITEYAADINLNVAVTASLDTLVITEYAATVKVDTGVVATLDTLVITEYAATVKVDTGVTATLDTLVITEYATTIKVDTGVTATLDTLVITEYAAVVTLGTNIDVTATLDTLVITEYGATIVNVPAIADFWKDITIQGVDNVTQERIVIVGKALHSKITASNVTLTKGGSASSVTDLRVANDGNVYHIDEVNDAPHIDLVVDFVDVTAFNWVNIIGGYKGVASHMVGIQVEITPFDGSAWYNYSSMDHHGTLEYLEDYSFFVQSDSIHINSGVVKVRFVHTVASPGNASHDMEIDIVALYK